ncbi:MAG: response regulator [Bacteroidetes bacterium]|nr:response regulator [Bacteroidota bacterium]
MNPTIDVVLIEENIRDAELTIRALTKYSLADKLIHLKNRKEATDFFFGTGEKSLSPIMDLPKLIMLDLKMEDGNALKILSELKSHDVLKVIPVVVLTASPDDPDIANSYRLGANSYIVKPTAFSDFLATISELGLYWLLLNKTSQQAVD